MQVCQKLFLLTEENLLLNSNSNTGIREDYAVTGIGVLGRFNDNIRDKSVRISITDDSK